MSPAPGRRSERARAGLTVVHPRTRRPENPFSARGLTLAEAHISKKREPAPTYRSPSGRYYDWARIIRDARAAGGLWFLALPAVAASKERDVRERRHPELVFAGGHLQADLRNPYTHNGRRLGDLYIRYQED